MALNKFVLSYLHSQIHHPQDTVLGMDEQAASVWVELQHVNWDANHVRLINFLQRENMKSFPVKLNDVFIYTEQAQAGYCAADYIITSHWTMSNKHCLPSLYTSDDIAEAACCLRFLLLGFSTQ